MIDYSSLVKNEFKTGDCYFDHEKRVKWHKVLPAENIYQTYKSRIDIEVMFDGMKNVLEADHTYMQNKQTLQGWMFINHIV